MTRSSSGSSVYSTSGASVTAPYWVELVRYQGTFSAYQSSDGVTWSSVGSQTISMSDPVYVGLGTSNGPNLGLGNPFQRRDCSKQWLCRDRSSLGGS